MQKDNKDNDMTLNNARKIEWVSNAATVIIALPFAIIAQILEWIEQPFRWILDGRNWLMSKLGNKLLHMSDAVKDGTIKNPYCLRNYTAQMAWKRLKEEEKEKMMPNIK